jgi:hypothetical protein
MVASIIRNLLFGLIFGVTVAIAGIMIRLKKTSKNGLFVNFQHLQKDDYILFYLKQLRPYYQTSKFSVSLGFSKFIQKVDQALDNNLLFQDQFFIIDCMSLLSDHPKESSQTLNNLKDDMQKLLSDHMKA